MHLQIILPFVISLVSGNHYSLRYTRIFDSIELQEGSYYSKPNRNFLENEIQKPVGVNIHSRIGLGKSGVNVRDNEMCKTRKIVIPPEADWMIDDVWRYIFHNGDYGIEAEECVNPGQPCEIMIPGYGTTCEQKYVYKTSVSEKSKRHDGYKIPAGCVCKFMPSNEIK